jgi:uncharacterized membrane protein
MRRKGFILAIFASAWLVFIMLAMPIWKADVFLQRGTISPGGEMAILVGFVVTFLFNVVTITWLRWSLRKPGYVQSHGLLLALGAVCLLLMPGEKAMIDEIGREYALGWEVTGEWIILYVFLAVQLVYSLLIVRQLALRATSSETAATDSPDHTE